MMINKRLIGTVPESKKHIIRNVVYQWIGLAANIVMIFAIGSLLEKVIQSKINTSNIFITLLIVVLGIAIRFICSIRASKMSYYASKYVKKTLRDKIYRKLLKLGASYNEKVSTSEVVQVSVEGVEQLETYFGSYLPQFFYSMLAPVTLFIVLSFISIKPAVVLLICVPLIPVSIVAVQKFAKKLLNKYWGQYTTLGDSFLENLQGLTTLKIYQSDKYKNEQMNVEAEKFRKVTMKVLTMQLNSITLMDLVAYGGAALGVIFSIIEYRAGNIGFMGCFAIIMLAADFFLPLRLLGSYFHIAMNGMAASDKIFKLLDLPVDDQNTKTIDRENHSIKIDKLSFSYDKDREVLHGIDMEFQQGKFTSIVGESGCGKSTVAAILMGTNKNYSGSATIGNEKLCEISEQSIMESISMVSFNSYIFKGTVRDNLLMGYPNANDGQLWNVLKQVNLAGFLESQNGLKTVLLEKGSNLSGGQCQRLALARALLHNSPVYIFDEATSNIDVESENDIMNVIKNLTGKTVIMISHRLANVVGSDSIYVMQSGNIAGQGTHDELLNNNEVYSSLWNTQQSIENYTGGGSHEKKK